MRRILIYEAVFMATILADAAYPNTFERATISIGSNFSTCRGAMAGTTDGTEASISCGGETMVPGFALPVSMSTQAFASAVPNDGGLRVIIDLQNGINTGVIGPSTDPTQFNSAVGFNLDSQTQDEVTFSAGASVLFTWTIHEHMVNLSGDGTGTGPFGEHASFGFTPALQGSDEFFSCDLNCRQLGNFVPGTGNVFDATITRTEMTSITPGQIIHLFDRMNLNGVVQVQAGPHQENEHVDLDFLDPVTVSAQVFDAEGNPLVGVRATSALGVDYLHGTATSPEPDSLCLSAGGFLIVIVIRLKSLQGIRSND